MSAVAVRGCAPVVAVSAAGSPLARREKLRILADRIDALLAEARQLGFSDEELFDLIRQRGRALEARPEEAP